MSTNQSIEERVTAIERQLQELKQGAKTTTTADWLNQITGSMEKYPEFEEVVRLGNEFRKSQSDPSNGH